MRTKDIGLYWVGAILFVVACIGGWALYWNLNKSAVEHRQDIRVKSSTYQAGVVARDRAIVLEYDSVPVDSPQAKSMANTFCTTYLELTQPPADLVQAYERICR